MTDTDFSETDRSELDNDDYYSAESSIVSDGENDDDNNDDNGDEEDDDDDDFNTDNDEIYSCMTPIRIMHDLIFYNSC